MGTSQARDPCPSSLSRASPLSPGPQEVLLLVEEKAQLGGDMGGGKSWQGCRRCAPCRRSVPREVCRAVTWGTYCWLLHIPTVYVWVSL